MEHYSSPYNHLIGEAAALYAIASSFPEFAESDWQLGERDERAATADTPAHAYERWERGN